jgi:hypothetical protein
LRHGFGGGGDDGRLPLECLDFIFTAVVVSSEDPEQRASRSSKETALKRLDEWTGQTQTKQGSRKRQNGSVALGHSKRVKRLG